MPRSGSFRAFVASLAAGLLFVLGVPGVASAADGPAIYEANCAKCHGSAGQADTKSARTLKVPKLDDPELAGEGGPSLAVKSVRENKKHRKVSPKLDDAELAAVAEYVRQLAAALQ
jgi:mono/diheme cytochrome c family protein